MKNVTFGAAMALSVFASSAYAEGNTPTMMMDEQVIKNQTASASDSIGMALPIIIMVLLIVVALSGDAGDMMYYPG